jgi:hypothetical protein
MKKTGRMLRLAMALAIIGIPVVATSGCWVAPSAPPPMRPALDAADGGTPDQ